jgi:hypothetical protein
LPFAEVLVPRLELAHHASLRQPVEVAPHGRLADAQGAGRVRRIPYLAVQVSQHGPEAGHRRRRHVHAELRQVVVHEAVDCVRAPHRCVVIGRGRERGRKPAPQPEAPRRVDSDLGQGERGDFDHLHAAEKRFTCLPQHRRTRATQQKVLSWSVVTIDEHSQEAKELGGVLDLVDDDKLMQRREGVLRGR